MMNVSAPIALTYVSGQFSAPDLSEIARELDEHEQRELDQNERATTSNNMDDTGAYHCAIYRDNASLTVIQVSSQCRCSRRHCLTLST